MKTYYALVHEGNAITDGPVDIFATLEDLREFAADWGGEDPCVVYELTGKPIKRLTFDNMKEEDL